MRYAVIGTGAVGGFYGARLARAGAEVHFLLHSDYQHVRENGLKVESPEGDFRLPEVNAYGSAADMPAVDVVIVAIKSTHNHLLPELLPTPAGDGGVVLMLQNGLGIDEQAAAIVGPDRVMSGLCFICSNKAGPGRIQHLDYGFVTLADYEAGGKAKGITDRMRRVGGDLAAAGIKVELAEDLVLARWQKLIWNVPFNGLSVVLGSMIDEIMADEHTRRLAEELMWEVAAGAKSQGRTIEAEFVRNRMELTDKMTPYRTSMMIDHEAARAMEVEAIYGEPVRTARRAGVELPRVEMLYEQLKFIDERNRLPAAHEG